MYAKIQNSFHNLYQGLVMNTGASAKCTFILEFNRGILGALLI